ncbi:MAG: transglutaminase domain-containing protein, partial [Chitinophagaceae bacterium]
MKLFPKWLFTIIILFAFANVFIFIKRNNGFEYVKYAGIGELYPDEPGSAFLNKWNSNNQQFSNEELEKGSSLLKKYTTVNPDSDETEIILSIACWLYKSFYQQQGNPDSILSGLTPLQQYNYLQSGNDKKLWCGNFQRMFGFFCTAAGLKNRYIEIVPKKENTNSGFHELNEVYLDSKKKWVMVDITRNLFLISKNVESLSAAGYYNYRLGTQHENLLKSGYENDSM